MKIPTLHAHGELLVLAVIGEQAREVAGIPRLAPHLRPGEALSEVGAAT
ncbi:hypothetical protein [Erythrobacter sp. 3-20A1M]|nr:hypothetical protein [Erythrobacter sp. 3-20A1M]